MQSENAVQAGTPMTARGEEATLSWGTVHTAPFFLLFRNILGVWGQSPQRIGVSRNTSPKEKGPLRRAALFQI